MTLKKPTDPILGNRLSASKFGENVSDPLFENDQYLEGLITAMQATLDGLPTDHYQATIPTSATFKDTWVDTSVDPNRLYFCKQTYASGGDVNTNWALIGDNDARTQATTAQASADASTRFLVSDTVPTDCTVGWVWVDSNENDRAYRCINSYINSDGDDTFKRAQFVEFDAYPLSEVQRVETDVQQNKKNIVINATVPDAFNVEDFWVDSDNSYELRVCTNSYRSNDYQEWDIGASYIVGDVVTGFGNYYVCIQDTTFGQNPNNPSYWVNQGPDSFATANDYKEAQFTAVRDLTTQANVDGVESDAESRIRLWAQNTPPNASSLGPFIVGDLWFETDTNDLHYCNVAHTDGSVAVFWTRIGAITSEGGTITGDTVFNGNVNFNGGLQVFEGVGAIIEVGDFLTRLSCNGAPSQPEHVLRLADWTSDRNFTGATAGLESIDAINTEIVNARGLSSTLDGRLDQIGVDINGVKSHQTGQIKAFVNNITERDNLTGLQANDVAMVWDDGSGDLRAYLWDGSSWSDFTLFYDKYEIAHRLELDYDAKIASAQSTLQGNITTVQDEVDALENLVPSEITTYGKIRTIYVHPNTTIGDGSGSDASNAMFYGDFKTLAGERQPYFTVVEFASSGAFGSSSFTTIRTDMRLNLIAGVEMTDSWRIENCACTLSGSPFECNGVVVDHNGHLHINPSSGLLSYDGGIIGLSVLRNSYALVAGTSELYSISVKGNSGVYINSTSFTVDEMNIGGNSGIDLACSTFKVGYLLVFGGSVVNHIGVLNAGTFTLGINDGWNNFDWRSTRSVISGNSTLRAIDFTNGQIAGSLLQNSHSFINTDSYVGNLPQNLSGGISTTNGLDDLPFFTVVGA